MDISKASNFERYVFDLADRDPAVVRTLWNRVAQEGGFDIAGTALAAKLKETAFVSGRSTHGDRLDTIRAVAQRYGVVVDPHTADGLKVALQYRDRGETVIAIETALPAKFAETIVEALGTEPPRPAVYENIESLPQRYGVLPADVDVVKDYIVKRAG